MTNHYRELKDAQELFCLRRLAGSAPDMKLREARSLATDQGETFAKMMGYSIALAILAETVLKFGPNGEIPPDDDRRPAIAWALKQAQSKDHGFGTV